MKKLLLSIILFINVKESQSQIISTIAGDGVEAFAGDAGPSFMAEIASPTDVAVDGAGNVYIADSNNSRVRKINSSGIITTIAGDGTIGYSGNGSSATLAQLGRPVGITLDSAGNIYIAETDNHRIRKISALGIITLVAGNGLIGYTGDGGPATSATLNFGDGIAADKAGNVYIADFGNHVIRKINTLGIISTVAGNGTHGNSGDAGLAVNAQLNYPNGVAVDTYGNLFISDMNNNKIRKVNTSGIISTYAGSAFGSPGFSGDGGYATSALLSQPQGIEIDIIGNLYISDAINNRIRVIDPSGIINTCAGNGTFGYSGDGGLATYANIGGRAGIAVDNAGNLYLAESYTNRIRQVNNITTDMHSTNRNNSSVSIYPNPSAGKFTVISGGKETKNLQLFNVAGDHVWSREVNGGTEIDASSLSDGVYTLMIKDSHFITVEKIVIVR